MATVNLHKAPRLPKLFSKQPFYVYTLIVVIASFVAMLATSILYTNHVAQRNEREWCELLTFYDDYYISNPPQSPLQKQQADMMHRRVIELNCY